MTVDDFNETVGARRRNQPRAQWLGRVFNTLGRRPRAGDAVTFDGITLAVEDMAGMRIAGLRIELARSLGTR